MTRNGITAAAALVVLLMSGCATVETPEEGVAVAGSIAVERLALLPDEVPETSGLALVDNQLWTVNDSGNEAALYGLTPDDGSLSKVQYLAGAGNVDWEALAADGEHLYIADCGNNRGSRAQLDLYAVAIDDLGAPDGSRVDYRRMHFRYGERLEVTASDDHNYDCEALAAVDDSLWLFSKNRGDGRSRLYRLDPGANDQTVFPVATFPVGGLVTGADFDPVSRRLALIGYSREWLFGHSFLWLVPVPGELPDWSAARRYRLGIFAQWEAVSWNGPGRLLLTTERSPLTDAMLGEILLDDRGEPLPARKDGEELW